jgi:hypothetical protein
MANFEAQLTLFSRASTSLCRSIRIAQMLNLHRIDKGCEAPLLTLPPPKDWSELEERRRTWWVIFCSDGFVCGTTGWPTLINERDVSSTSTLTMSLNSDKLRFIPCFQPRTRHSMAVLRNRRAHLWPQYGKKIGAIPHLPEGF